MINSKQRELIKNYINYIVLIVLILLFSTVANFIAPLTLKYGIDNFKELDVCNIIFLFFGSFALYYISRLILCKVQFAFSLKFKVEESKVLYKKVFKMKYLKLLQLEPTYLVEKIKICIDTLFMLFSDSISNMLIAILTMVISLVIAFSINVYIGLLFILLIPLYYYGYKSINKKLSIKSMNLQNVCANNFKEILSIMSNVDYIKQNGDNKNILGLIEKNLFNIEKENCEVNKFAKNTSTLLEFSIKIIENIIYVYLVILFLNKNVSLSIFVFANLICGIYLDAVKQIGNININLRDLVGVTEFLETEIEGNLEEDKGNIHIPAVNKISFKVEDFGYEDTLIKEGEFEINRGDIVAVTGKSGTGKSSLIKGLLKFYDINSIYINDTNIKLINTDNIRRKIDYLSQNVILLPLSIEENILLGKSDKCLNYKNIIGMPFMQKFKNDRGLQTIVLENGSNLSGGDKQKIAIARMMLNDPDVIILDESTSSIDNETAKEILEIIKEKFIDKIIIVISHDDRIVKMCNKVVEIKDQGIFNVRDE